jgi:hypothetical protein
MSLPENGVIYPPSLPAINLVADYIMFPLWITGIISQSAILYTFIFKFKGAYSTNNKFVIVISVCDWFTAAGCVGFRVADWISSANSNAATGWSTGKVTVEECIHIKPR